MDPDQIEEESENSFLAYAEKFSPMVELTDYFEACGAELKAIEHQADGHFIDQLKTDDSDLWLALSWKQRHSIRHFQEMLQTCPLESDEDYIYLGEMFDEDE